jgi:beta-galactosidase
VFLTVTEPVHVDTWGVHITTPEVSEEKATIHINTALSNEESDSHIICLVTTIMAPDGKEAGEAHTEYITDSKEKEIVSQEITVTAPALWSVDNPSLYRAVTEIREGNTVKDRVETSFGIRSITFDAEKGFLLNGETVLLRGGCIHHDNGPLGSAAFARAEERKVEILKRNGFNAIRSSHNPASTTLLEACDRLGMLVIEEAFDTWVRPKNPQDYHLYFNEWWQKDLEAMVLRGRNHPSVILWSIGNEVYEIPDLLGQEIAGKLSSEIRRLDSIRPVTAGIVYLPPFTRQPWERYEPSLAHLDIDGYNYFLETRSDFFIRDSLTLNRFDTEHAAHPKKVFYGSETLAIGALENWNKAEAVPYVLGCFKWTAFDYIGEAGIGLSRYVPQNHPEVKGLAGMGAFARDEWPVFNAFCGDFDLTGNKKAASYYQDVVWRISPVELLVHKPFPEGMKEWVAPWGFPEVVKSWSWPGHEGEKMQVVVYTRSEKVILELNGKVIAEQTIPQGEITATFEVAYQPGVLMAKSMNGGKVTGTSRLTTAGKPVAIRLTAEQPTNKDDLVYIQVEIVDEKGDVVPCIDDVEIHFDLEGEVTLAATGNGSPVDMSGFQQPHRKVYQGKALVIIRPAGNKGQTTLKARAEGLRSAMILVEMN